MACPAARQIPDHLLVEILSRLPAKSFFRSKCVSKSWLSLSFDPHYRKKLPSPMSGLFFNSTPASTDPNASLVSARYVDLSVDDTPISASFDFLPIHQNVEILDCCHGLLLCRSWDGSSANLKHYYVCNPATRKWTALPSRPEKFRFVALAFDPGLSRHFLVVHFKKLGSSTEIEVFSSKTGEWVECQLSKGNGTLRRFLYRPTVFFNGVVHILAGLNNVVRLDLELKVCRKIDLPESFGFGCLGHSGGYLCYAGCHHELHVWVLKDHDKSEWELKHHVDMDAILKERYTDEVLGYYSVVAFHPHIDVVYMRMRGKLLSYNLNTARLEEVSNIIHGMPHFFPYSPFLLDDDS